MFICTDGGGLRVYDEQTGKVTLSNLKVNDFELSTSNVKDALSDMYGNVWVGVYMKGVMMKPSGKSSFEYAGNRSIGKNSIGENAVFAISRDIDNNHIWIAPDNDGLYRISSDAVSSTHWNRKTNPGMPQGFTSIYPINSTTVLLGSFFDGLWMMNGNSFSLVTKEINQIFDIATDQKKFIKKDVKYYFTSSSTNSKITIKASSPRRSVNLSILVYPPFLSWYFCPISENNFFKTV